MTLKISYLKLQNGSKGLIMSVQAKLLKNLMLKSYITISGEEVQDRYAFSFFK